MAVIAFPTLQGWQHTSLVSPIFIYFLLTKISGVNLLENYADEKWGDDENEEEEGKHEDFLFCPILLLIQQFTT